MNSLQRAASYLQLKVNMSKSNIIVFRKGCYLGARERWTYNSFVMHVVNAYIYFGVFFSPQNSVSLQHVVTLQVKLRMRHYASGKDCE